MVAGHLTGTGLPETKGFLKPAAASADGLSAMFMALASAMIASLSMKSKVKVTKI